MGANVTVLSGRGKIGNVQTVSVQDDASPSIIGQASASVGDVTITAQADSNGLSKFLDRASIQIIDDTYGTYLATADKPSVNRTTITLPAGGLAQSMSITKTAPPIFGTSVLADAWAAYIGLCFTVSPTINYVSSRNPLVAFPGWSGNVWDMLNQLAAVYRQEIAFVNGVITIRDLGTAGALDISNVTSDLITRTVDSQAMAISGDVIYRSPQSVASVGPNIHNFANNPGLETNAVGWTATYAGPATGGFATAGALTSSGRSTSAFYQGAASLQATSTESTRFAGGPFYHNIDVKVVTTFTNIPSVGLPSSFSVRVQGCAQPTGKVSGSYGNSIILYIEWLDGSGSVVATSPTTSTQMAVNVSGQVLAGTWTNCQISSTAPSGAVSGRLNIIVNETYTDPSSSTALTGQVIYVDAFMATESSDTTYKDGASAGWAWNGVANNSPATGVNPTNVSFYDALADSNAQYSVDVGETTTVTIQTNNYPAAVVSPVRVTTFPVGVGQYYLSAQDNLPVASGQFEAYGGQVIAKVGTEPGTIDLTLIGPSVPIPGVAGPFTLAASDGTNNFAALNIAGAGVKTTPTVITCSTGAPQSRTQAVMAGPIDLPFIGTESQARDRMNEATGVYSGNFNTIGFRLSKKDCKAYGLMQGTMVTYDYSLFRVMSVTYDDTAATVTAQQRVMDSDMTAIWSGMTDAQITTFWGAGWIDADIMEQPLWH